MSLRAAIYARVSTDIQRDNYSIPSQIKEILNYATAHNLALVGDRYVDPVTGRDTATGNGAIPAFVDDFTSTELSRPGLDAALSFLDKTGFDILLVHAIDRLARDPYFRQTIEREFAARGTRVEYILGNYDETPEGEVRKDLDATFAKWENAKRVERFNRGKKRKAEMGRFVMGKVTYGYRLDDQAFAGLSVYEPEAKIVQMIFSLFVENRLSLYEIANDLSKLGVKTYHGHDVWPRSTVLQMLSNTIYAGYFYYNRTKRVGRKLVERDQSEWVKIECTPIIPNDIFEAAQDILKYNREYKRKQPKRFYMLSGMVFCSDCEKPYVTQTTSVGRRRPDVRVKGYRHRIKNGHCSNKWQNANSLEPLVWDGVVSILLDPKSLRDGYEQSIEQEQQKQARQIQHLETLQTAIEKVRLKRNRLQTIYLDPDIGMTKEEYLGEKKLLDDQMQTTLLDIERIEKELRKIPTERDLESLEQLASDIIGTLGSNLDISPEDKRRVLEMVNLKVLISTEGRIRLEGWFTPENDGLLSTTIT